ncbi:hypothetical protein X768_17750 [Mesorhizobium sp. LSJC265A00]|nr:hypothetical protein X768_17750 [Mesorhizobium sp. LSJC265A00]ESY06813.1 hypothetical protein X753_13135 [Mesorhizobium sp. LNJC399B00]
MITNDGSISPFRTFCSDVAFILGRRIGHLFATYVAFAVPCEGLHVLFLDDKLCEPELGLM